MVSGRTFCGKRLLLTAGFSLLLLAAFGAGCKGFFVDPTLTSITINPTAPSVQLGQTTSLTAFGVNNQNQGSNLTSGVSWSSSDITIATVSGTGSAVLTGVAAGTATITAASQSVTNTVTATVFITVSSMAITPTSQSIVQNGTTALPYIVKVNGNTDISSAATLTAFTSGGTEVTTIGCAYDASNPAGPGQYCTDNGSTATGTYTIVATYSGTTITAKATLNIT